MSKTILIDEDTLRRVVTEAVVEALEGREEQPPKLAKRRRVRIASREHAASIARQKLRRAGLVDQ